MYSFIIDTAGHELVLILAHQKQVIASYRQNIARGMGELLDAQSRCLLTKEIQPSELEQIIIVAGPGSYTGLRIGFSYAHGLTISTGSRLTAISRGELLIAGYEKQNDFGSQQKKNILCCFDSRRDDFYGQLFKYINGQGLAKVSEPQVLTLETAREYLKDNLISDRLSCIGDYAESAYQKLEKESNLTLDLIGNHQLSFEDYASYCHDILESGDYLSSPHPLYLSPAKTYHT